MPAAFKNLPMRSRLILGGGALAVLLVFFLLFRIASAPSFVPLATGLEPTEAGKVTEALDAVGLGYELQANGTTIAVEKAAVAQARIAIAETGIKAGGTSPDAPGYELLDKQKLGASDMQQRITAQRALEGEIARTVGNVQGVNGVQVRLVLPEEELFSDEATPASAAVLLSGAESMEPAAIRGVAQLVASSVKGLKTDNVTITDSMGQLVWPQGDGVAGGGSMTKLAAEQRYERALEASLMAMLAGTIGSDKARVQVKAQLNVDQASRETLRYADEGVALETERETERLRGDGAGARGGVAGVAGNIPGYAAGAAGGGETNYNREKETTKAGVDKEVERRTIAPGQVEDLSVALMLDADVPRAEAAAVRAAVASAAGVEARDVTLSSLPFAKAQPVAPPEAAGPVPAALLSPLKWAGLALAILIFLFFMTRHLRRRERDALAAPAWLTEIDRPVPLRELGGGAADETPALPLIPERQPDPSLFRLDQVVDREPQRVAAHVKQWLAED